MSLLGELRSSISNVVGTPSGRTIGFIGVEVGKSSAIWATHEQICVPGSGERFD